MWFFTNSKGQVARIDNIPYYTITEKFMENAIDKELVAVLKKVSWLLICLASLWVWRKFR